MTHRMKVLLYGVIALAVVNVLVFIGAVLAAIWLAEPRFADTAWLWFFVMVVNIIGAAVAVAALYEEE